ncbi:hypothetical protein ACFV14_24025 [Streptomyces zaomyceticus]|uniref:hypothetical protein n=1 Tax=Streptomyces zaomyceticus TaxID=68286 RepID=UPI0036CCD07C
MADARVGDADHVAILGSPEGHRHMRHFASLALSEGLQPSVAPEKTATVDLAVDSVAPEGDRHSASLRSSVIPKDDCHRRYWLGVDYGTTLRSSTSLAGEFIR